MIKNYTFVRKATFLLTMSCLLIVLSACGKKAQVKPTVAEGPIKSDKVESVQEIFFDENYKEQDITCGSAVACPKALVKIVNRQEQKICMGSLISQNTVLTTASCLGSVQKSNQAQLCNSLYFGFQGIKDSIRCKQIVFAGQSNTQAHYIKDNDYALIEINTPENFDITPMPFSQSGLEGNSYTVWSFENIGQSVSSIVSKSCEFYLQNLTIIDENFKPVNRYQWNYKNCIGLELLAEGSLITKRGLGGISLNGLINIYENNSQGKVFYEAVNSGCLDIDNMGFEGTNCYAQVEEGMGGMSSSYEALYGQFMNGVTEFKEQSELAQMFSWSTKQFGNTHIYLPSCFKDRKELKKYFPKILSLRSSYDDSLNSQLIAKLSNSYEYRRVELEFDIDPRGLKNKKDPYILVRIQEALNESNIQQFYNGLVLFSSNDKPITLKLCK